MSQTVISVGSSPNDGTGDPARTAFAAINAMFAELYGLTGLGWDDLRYPVSGINPAGAANAPTFDTTLAGVTGTLLFSGSQENVLAWQVQMPHAWMSSDRGGTGLVVPHIHWSLPTPASSAVTWQLYYRVIGNVGDALGAWVGPLTPDGTIGDQANVGVQQLLTYWSAIDLSAYRASAMLACRLHRLGNTDANNGDARLYETDFHIQQQGFGTINQYGGSP